MATDTLNVTTKKPMITAAEVISSIRLRMGQHLVRALQKAAIPVLFHCIFSCFVPPVKRLDSVFLNLQSFPQLREQMRNEFFAIDGL